MSRPELLGTPPRQSRTGQVFAGCSASFRSIARSAGWIFVFGAAVSVHTQDRGFWSFIEPGRVLTRCAEASAAHTQAAASLKDLEQRIARLKDTDSPAKAVEELHALLRSECFLTAAETRVPRPDTSVSLKQWLIDGGGSSWLESFLELPRLGLMDDLALHVVVPPDARKTLNLEAHKDHPLSSLLCESGDTPCGAATRGWRLRADVYLQSHRALGRNDASIPFRERPASGVGLTSRECAGKASSSDPGQRYQAWRTCIERQRPTTVALPLGELKAPAAGWIVISGRRGHYDFCDTTRAYDLATGAAFVSDSCSGLALKRAGDVDFDATNRARVERIGAGTVPVENLREAVWMMVFRGEAEEVQLQAEYYPLPAGLVPQVTVREQQADLSGVPMNTGQTLLTWRWVPPAGSAFVGALTWPDSYDAAEDHAVSLLNIAEHGLVEGCAAQRLPAPAVFSSAGAHNLNDVPAESIERLGHDFSKAFAKWKSLAPCRR